MILDYEDIMDNIISYLESVNTATAAYPLNTGLPSKIKKVEMNDLDLYSPDSALYPYIGIQLGSIEGDALNSNSATNADREVEFNFIIHCIVEASLADDAHRNLYRLIRNIETNIRLNVDLTNSTYPSGYETAFTKLLYMRPGGATPKANSQPDSIFNRAASIIINCKALVTP